MTAARTAVDHRGAAEAAVRYALAGVPVLPLYEVRERRCACGRPRCERPGKHPRTPNGVHDASTDVELVARWWRWWPTANVGAATGHVFDVWDIDLPDPGPLLAEHLGHAVADTSPAAGTDALCGAVAEHDTRNSLYRRRHELSRGRTSHGPGQRVDQVAGWPMARTGSGGTHVFVAATGHGNRTRFLPGCDWRGRGGYVVLPPSVHISGRRYMWLATTRVVAAAGVVCQPAPPALLRALMPQPLRATRGGRAWSAGPPAGYAQAALNRECDALAVMRPDSGRNNALNRAAFNLGQLVAAGRLDEHTVTAALAAAAADCGLGEREAARTIASGLAAGQRHPRTRRGGGTP